VDGMSSFKKNKVHYRNHSDFFSLGLNLDQIEKIIRINKKHIKKYPFYTTGYNVNIEIIKYLTKKYPQTFRLWLSIITFNNNLKKKVIANWTNSKKIKEIIKISKDPSLFLLHFNYKQTIKDLEIINKIKKSNKLENVYISSLYYDKFHSNIIKSLTNKSYKDFEKLINYLMSNKSKLRNIKSLSFDFPPEAFLWKFRNKFKIMFENYNLNNKDIILCSKGSCKIIKFLIKNQAKVFPVSDSLYGSTNFTTTITTTDLIKNIKSLLNKNSKMKRIFVPSSIWWINNKYDFEGNSIKVLQKKFPNVQIISVKIPWEITFSVLSLKECYDYYNYNFKKNKEIKENKNLLRKFLLKCEDKFNISTKAGYLRRLSTYPQNKTNKNKSEIIINYKILDKLAKQDKKIIVTYYEPIIENSNKIYSKEQSSILLNNKKIFIKKYYINQIELKNQDSIILFNKLFIEKKNFKQIIKELSNKYKLNKDIIESFNKEFQGLEYI
jgi:hypothetical protein